MGNIGGRKSVHNVTYPSSVEEVFVCPMRKWAKSEYEKWGFDHRINYKIDLRRRLQPWATCGRYITARIYKRLTYSLCSGDANFEAPASSDDKWLVVVEDFYHSVVHLPQWYSLRGVCCLKENPIKLSDRFDAKVIGARDDFLVVQLIRENESQNNEWTVDILIMEMDTGGVFYVKSVFTFNTLVLPYMMEATLSPDHKYMCLKPSWEYIMSFSQYPTENNMMVVDIAKEKGILRHRLFKTEGTECVIAFDPRYEWRRLAVGNRSATDDEDLISVYDLEDQCVVKQSEKSREKQTTHNLVYSPDGSYVASLVVDPTPSAWRGLVKTVEMVILYSSDELEVLHRCPCNHIPTPINTTPVALFPLFSKAGDYMCFQKDNVRKYWDWQVVVLALPVKISLQFICRVAIRKFYTSAEIRSFPFPKKLKDFILFAPYIP